MRFNWDMRINRDMRINWDFLGMSASIACAIHCAVLPVFLTTLPLFGFEILHNPWFEAGMIGIAFVIGTGSLYQGYKKHHRRVRPVMFFTAGFIFLVLKEVFEAYHVVLLVPAVGLILAAHYLNLRYTARRKDPEPTIPSAPQAHCPKGHH